MLLEMETFGIYIKLSNFDYIGPFQYIIWYNIQDKVTTYSKPGNTSNRIYYKLPGKMVK